MCEELSDNQGLVKKRILLLHLDGAIALSKFVSK